ncbi:MAG: acyl carrier protein [Parasporobacterium sp.]|nr:acyl carrier protein [Parasporobacterium sp.]
MKKLIEILTDINEDVDFANEKALVDDGLIDSFDITSIITALDEEYDVRIEASEIEPENFNSVEAILETVKKYQAKR